jgi:hypothetical protein
MALEAGDDHWGRLQFGRDFVRNAEKVMEDGDIPLQRLRLFLS